MLENLLAANVAHGKKLVALILSFPESQSDEGGPESPEPAVPTARHVGVLCLLVQLDAPFPAQYQPSLSIMSASHRTDFALS